MDSKTAARENGSFKKDGETYILTAQAVAENYAGAESGIAYTAIAIKANEWDDESATEYRAWWEMRDDFDYTDDADEGNACDWEHPVSVEVNN